MLQSLDIGDEKTQSDHRNENPLCQQPPSGIEVLIVGGGVAGLYFALESLRQGHKPLVVESKLEDEQPAGDYFVIGASATENLKYWPLFKKSFDSYAQDTWMSFYRHNGAHILGPYPMPKQSGKILIRQQMHQMMLAEVKRQKIPILYGDKVVDYFENVSKAGVILRSGKRLEADLVAACDGVHSKSWKVVTGRKDDPFPTGYSILRCSMPTEQALHNELVRQKFNRKEGDDGKVHDTLEFLLGPNIHANMTIANGISCWLVVYKDQKSDTDAIESWSNSILPSEALNIVNRTPGWDPVFLELIKSSPPIVDWRLMTRNPEPKWVSDCGRIVQVGDSAHPFLPTSANGATQAMEDAVSLAACLRCASNPDEVPTALWVHNRLRFERVSCSQLAGLFNREQLHGTDWDTVLKDPAVLKKAAPANWIFVHNPEQYAIDNYNECAKSLSSGEAFQNTNIPKGYVFKQWDAKVIIQAAADGHRLQLQGDWS